MPDPEISSAATPSAVPPSTDTPPTADTARRARNCPTCGTRLDHTGNGGDEVLECSTCGLVMFDQRRRV
jgi:hypothetical protein